MGNLLKIEGLKERVTVMLLNLKKILFNHVLFHYILGKKYQL